MKALLDWLEVWPLLTVIIVLVVKARQPQRLTPVVIYVLLAFAVNLTATLSWKLKPFYQFPSWFQINTYFYSLHAIVRAVMLSWFFIQMPLPYRLVRIAAFVIFFIAGTYILSSEPFINYWFEDGKMKSIINYHLLAGEAALMILYCLQYYILKLMEESSFKADADFWIVTGLAIFSFCSFPVYFFYQYLLLHYVDFAINIWVVQKVSFFIFCMLLVKAFLVSSLPVKIVA